MRVGRLDGQTVINPTFAEQASSDLDLVVTCTRGEIIMVEGSCEELGKSEVLGSLDLAHKSCIEIIDMIEELTKVAGKEKVEFVAPETDEVLKEKVRSLCDSVLDSNLKISLKQEREEDYDNLRKKIVEDLSEEYPESVVEIKKFIGEFQKEKMRRMVIDTSTRIDGRKLDEIRPITCELGYLPRVHGSAIFYPWSDTGACFRDTGYLDG